MKHVFENFLDPLVIVFGEPKTTDVAKFLNEYAALLVEYDADELVAAKIHIMKNQKGKFFPTPGECLDACSKAQQTEGPKWPDRMLERIASAASKAELKGFARRIEKRRKSYYSETIERLLAAVEAKSAAMGEGPVIVDIAARMTGEGSEA